MLRPLAAALVCTALPAFAQTASVAGTDGTNALGSIPCSPLAGVALQSCPAELLRKGDGKATLRVLLPGGRTRSIYFEGGEAVASSGTEKVRGKEQGGTYYVFIGENERFQLPASALK